MAQDIPQLIASARGFLTSQAYGSDERTVLIAIVDQLEKAHLALRLFTGAAFPVSEEINRRGYNWSEAYLDQALADAKTERLV